MPKQQVRRQALADARRAAGLTQEDMARMLGITRAAYTRYETGSRRLTLQMAARIAHILQRPVDELFPEDFGLRRSA